MTSILNEAQAERERERGGGSAVSRIADCEQI